MRPIEADSRPGGDSGARDAARRGAAVPRRVLPTLVLSQFCGTSLWFAANAVMPDLQRDWGLPATAAGSLSSAVQLGFVCGTLVFALLMLADRLRPTWLFCGCSLLGALANAGIVLLDGAWWPLLALRFAVGFLLAGIYPVGMRIAAGWYREGLGAALGVLIGALVLGTALPHGVRALGGDGLGGGGVALPWQALLLGVSALAALGGLATLLLVPANPDAPSGAAIRLRGLAATWRDARLRASVFGYFGHMWELYTLYVLVPLILATRLSGTAVSAGAFWAIASGAVGCVAGGLLARRFGSARIAAFQLAASGACALAAPLLLGAPMPLFLAWLLLWGMTAAGDSPQFSALTARNAPPAAMGSVLTLVNCVGFAITVLSIEWFTRLAGVASLAAVLPWLAAGPALGLLMLRPLLRGSPAPAPPGAGSG